jgi:xanthine dehydrogenase accessory factor
MSSPAENTSTISVIRTTLVAGAEDATCEVAHGHGPVPDTGRALVAVFFSPVAQFLLRYGQDAGFHPVLVEPDPGQA